MADWVRKLEALEVAEIVGERWCLIHGSPFGFRPPHSRNIPGEEGVSSSA